MLPVTCFMFQRGTRTLYVYRAACPVFNVKLIKMYQTASSSAPLFESMRFFNPRLSGEASMEEEQREIKYSPPRTGNLQISNSLNLRTIFFPSHSLPQNLPIIPLYHLSSYQQKENRLLRIRSSVFGAWETG